MPLYFSDAMDLLGAAIALGLVLMILPRKVFPRIPGANALEQHAADLVWACASITVLAVVLVPAQLFQTMCFVLLASGGMWYRWRRRGGSLKGTIDRWATRCRAGLYLFEAASPDGNLQVKQAVRAWMRHVLSTWLRPSAPAAERMIRWALIVPLFVIVAAVTCLHLLHPFRHAGFFPASAYDTLARMGELTFGQLFDKSIGSPGLSAVLATAAKLGPASDADLVRFAGPLLLIPALMIVYAIALRASGKPGTALAAVSLAGVASLRPDTLPGFALPGTVPGGLASVLGLAAVLLAMGYGAAPSRARAWTIAASVLGVALVDPAHLALPVAAAGAAGIAVAARSQQVWLSLRPICLAVPAVALGLAPYLVTAASRGERHGIPLPTLSNPADNPLLVIASAAGLVLVLARHLGRRRPRSGALAALALTMVAAALYREADILLAVGPVLALEALRFRAPQPLGVFRLGRSMAFGLATAVGLVVLVQPSTPPPAAASEHESAATVLDQLLNRETSLSYTVVGPPTWTSRVVGSAFRVDLAEFARRLTTVDAIDPGFTLPVPSIRVLVLTEKQAFATSFGGHPYDDPTARAQLVESVQQWLMTYAQFHSGAEIVYEDEMIRVWSINQARDAALSERFGIARQ